MKRRQFLARLSSSVIVDALPTGGRVSADSPGPQITLASNEIYPMLYRERGEITGVLFDIVNELSARAGMTVHVQLLPWARCIEEAKTGAIDGVFAAFKTPEREAFLAFPREPIMTQQVVFFVRQGSQIKFDGDFAKLADFRIGVVNRVSFGDKFDRAARDGSLRRLETAAGAENVMKMLVSGHVDLVVLNVQEGLGIAKMLNITDRIMVLEPPLDRTPAYIAFTKARDMSGVMARFDEAMRVMGRDGSYTRIMNAYSD